MRRELDSDAMRGAVIVDSREAAMTGVGRRPAGQSRKFMPNSANC